MRIQPGSPESPQQPSRATGGAPAPGAGFRGVLARRIAEASIGWRRALGADPQWSAAPVLAPPPRPTGLESEGPETARFELHQIAATPADGPAARRMQATLGARLMLEEKMLTRIAVRKG